MLPKQRKHVYLTREYTSETTTISNSNIMLLQLTFNRYNKEGYYKRAHAYSFQQYKQESLRWIMQKYNLCRSSRLTL